MEDNPDDQALTLRAFRRNNIGNKLIVVQDGAEALDFLFCAGDYVDCDPQNMPEMVLLDLRLPKVDGLEVLRRIREAEQTRLLPVVILTSSKADKDLVESYQYGVNSYMRKPVDLDQLIEAVRQLNLHLLVLNGAR